MPSWGSQNLLICPAEWRVLFTSFDSNCSRFFQRRFQTRFCPLVYTRTREGLGRRLNLTWPTGQNVEHPKKYLYLGPTIPPARPCWPKASFGLVSIMMRIDDGQAALTASLPRLSLHVLRLGCSLKDWFTVRFKATNLFQSLVLVYSTCLLASSCNLGSLRNN